MLRSILAEAVPAIIIKNSLRPLRLCGYQFWIFMIRFSVAIISSGMSQLLDASFSSF
jgi:hypothetical protein